VDEIDRLLDQVKWAAHGKLPLHVYRRIHDTAARCRGTLVEIGTSQGAATIAMALGAATSGHPFRILTCDPFRIGLRPHGPSLQAKLDVVRRGFERFGVAASIHVVAGTVGDLVAAHDPQDIGLLLLDADGRIDRDLELLHDRLAPDCPIIIDDIDERTYLHRRGRKVQVDQKHRLTHLLVEQFVRQGLLVPQAESGQTGWYAKGKAASAGEIERLALPCYRELVSTAVGFGDFTFKHLAYRFLADHAAWLLRGRERLRRRR
jgi:predicted O-methyltransferase YrrM